MRKILMLQQLEAENARPTLNSGTSTSSVNCLLSNDLVSTCSVGC